MKVTASIAALAFAASAVAVPAWPEAAPTTTTTTTVKPTTTTAASGTWDDWAASTTTTTPVKPATTTTTPAAEPTWADWEEPDSWTTTIVTAVTTYCPAPTTIVHGAKTWVVTAPSTLTLTEGPFTISVPVFTKVTTSCSATPVAPTGAASTWADWSSTAVAPVVSSYVPTGTGVKPATFTGAANSLVANVGAGLAGVGAIAAFLL